MTNATIGLPSPTQTMMRVSVVPSFEAAAPVWDRLSRQMASPYQTCGWVSAYHRHAGAGHQPLVIVIENGHGEPVLMLPLEVVRKAGVGTAQFVGEGHANFGLPVFAPAAMERLEPQTIAVLMAQAAAASPVRVDLFHLRNQPRTWMGHANPLAALGQRVSPSLGHHLVLGPDGDDVLSRVQSGQTRKKLRKKERALEETGALRLVEADNAVERTRVVDEFLRQKAQRCRTLGISNAFAAPEIRDFILAAAETRSVEDQPVLRLFALTCDNTVLATFGGAALHGRFCGMFNAMTEGPLAKESPGEILLQHLIRRLCAEGMAVFDLGAGEARYKSSLCDGEDALVDTLFGVTMAGRTAAIAFGAATDVKRSIKQSPTLWPLVEKWRRARGGRAA